MTGSQFASLVRKYTRSNTTTFPNSDIVLYGNVAKDDMTPDIMKQKEDEFVVPATTDLVADQREYPLPQDKAGSITKIEAKFATGDEFIELDEIDINAIDFAHNEDDITQIFANEEGKAKYDLRRDSIYIYSGTIVNVTAGLKLWYSAYPDDISTATLSLNTDLSIAPTTTSVTIPRMFHELWARRTAMIWKQSKEKPLALNERELKFEADFEEKLDAYRLGNTDRVVVAQLPDDSEEQYA